MAKKKQLTSLWQAISFNDCLFAILIITVTISATAVVFSKHKARKYFASLQNLQKDIDKVHVEWSQLLLEQGAWVNLSRIERIAREKLAMEPSENKEIVVINND